MQWTAWSIARNVARPALSAALASTVLIAATVVGAVAWLTASLAETAARDALLGSPPATLTIRARAGTDADDQDRRARSSLTTGFAPATLEISTVIDADPVPLGGSRLLPRHDPSALARGTIVAGRAPAAQDEAAMQADAAARLGIGVGRVLDLRGVTVTVTVTATWRPADPGSASWAGDPLALRGTHSGVSGPLLVSRPVVEAISGTPVLTWSLVPDLSGAGPAEFDALSSGAARAKALVEVADDTGRGVTVEGALGERVDAAADDWADARRLGQVPLGVVWLLALLTLVQVGRVVAASRDAETRLLLARGTTVASLTVLGLAESAVIAAVGAALGGVGAALGMGVVTGSWGLVPEAIWGAAVAAGTAVVAFTGAVAGRAQALARSSAPDRGRTAAALGGAAGVLVLAAAAALATWRLTAAGTLPAPGGPWDPDRAAALAPAALLVVAGALAPLVLGPLTGAVARLLRRATRGVVAWLAVAHLTRAVLTAAVPALLMVVAIGSVTMAGLFGGASLRVGADLAALERGADVRATLAAPPAAGLALPSDAAAVAGASASAPVWTDGSARVGDSPVVLVSGPLDGLAATASLPEGVAVPEPPGNTGLLAGALPIPAGARELTVSLDGGIRLDPWQDALARQVPELSRRQADAPYILDQDDAATELTLEALSRLRTGATVRVEVLVRDLLTGVSRRLPAVDLAVPGLDLSWDGSVVIGPAAQASGSGRVELPGGGRFVVDGVGVRVPDGPSAATLELAVTLAADGVPLGPTGDWASDVAVPDGVAGPYRDLLAGTPVEVGIAEIATDGELTAHVATTNRPEVPPLLTPVQGGWRLTGEPSALAATRLGPHVAFTGRDPAGVVESSAPPPVPVTLTSGAAEEAGLGPGDRFEIDAFQRRLPAEVASVVDVMPGATQPHAALADSRAVSAALAVTADPMPWPRELWVAAGDPDAVAASLAELPGVESVAHPAAGTPAATLARRTFWTGAAGGVALAVAGVAATFVAQLDSRRGETAVLRTLGLGGRAQGRSRALEHAGVTLTASLLGVAAGGLVGALVVPPLVRSAVGADARWPIPLTVDAGGWFALVTVAALSVGAVVAVIARAVARQAAGGWEGHR